MSAATAWFTFRVLRWALWLAVVGYYILFAITRDSHLNAFGHLLTTTELWMFGLPLAAVFAGCIEVMLRDRAGLAPPAIGRDWSFKQQAGV